MQGTSTANRMASIPRNKKVKVLVVPGNPGHAGFYQTFQTALQEKLGHHASVTCISHRGHGAVLEGWNATPKENDEVGWAVDGEEEDETKRIERLDRPDKGQSVRVPGWLDVDDKDAFAERPEDNRHPHSLASQCSFWKEVAQSHVAPDNTLVLVGHSIGAYIAVDAASRVQGDVRVVGVMPFLRRDAESQHQRRMQQITTPVARFVLGMIASGLSKLPKAWRVGIIRRATSPQLSIESSHVVADWIHGGPIMAALRTAAHEFHDLAPQRVSAWRGWQWLSCQADKPSAAFFYGADGDVWANPRDAIHLSSRFPHMHIKMFSAAGLRHDFCVDLGQSHAVAEDVAGWIRDACLQ
uniref:AB hydrolase-1 domain-containing protein n=1 Tax=Picocystis salinarum TaxID=88271 RepID=A0A7S3XF15_9CHLO|mmetsp:Transcript_10416/g.63622  ORF Transcript_10416/g.63622 Transcript_10416/m.63622 type:complete len:354 (-) Transcript_10416:2075-3136(-)